MKYLKRFLFILIIILGFNSCNNSNNIQPVVDSKQRLTIFFTNDMHGQLDNFAKIKHIVDNEKETTNVMLVSGGDIFSGNPIVDQAENKGFPIIDVMNKTGYDVTVIGNHEFDYGQDILNDRMAQAEFDWVLANVNTEETNLAQPQPYVTKVVDDIKITVLGLVETFGKENATIPATHPWRVAGLIFQDYFDVIADYRNLKKQEDADVYIALTHLGNFSDTNIANEFPYYDLIIGGHSNNLNDKVINDIPVLIAGNSLSHLGRIRLIIEAKKVVSHEIELINLANYDSKDETLEGIINQYNNAPEFAEVIGAANSHLNRDELGCFYTTALKEYMKVDFSIQNSGGIRNVIDQGDVTRQEIFNMDPFNNGSVVFTMTAREIKDFFIKSKAGLHVSGITLIREGSDIKILDENGNEIADDVSLTLGTNDFIPAIYDDYFFFDKAEIRPLTTAETIIDYMKTINSTIDHENCNHFFRY
jgi:2',3'-cyclic-nucleotide 2'-phosphodiesterase (5'-nucleotidase family)